ncbi:MAG: class II fumarate hydratase, partial [Clostridia bacterium]|nr:class II fumarate hydratase [Clostridia bacterium]
VRGITANRDKMRDNLDRSLMLVTALNPHIGYDAAARVAKTAFAEDISLLEAVVKLGLMSEADARAALDPSKMV